MNAVYLKGLQFHAYHGLYPGEELTGGPFEVNLTVRYQLHEAVTRLEQTVNYAELYEIVKKEMDIRRDLLETVAESVCQAVYQQYNFIREIEMEIWKLSPPIEQFEGKTGISLHKIF
jgi:dihydroneopterin aldolase